MALSNVLIIVLRPDEQDFEGTGVTVRVARRLQVPQMLIVVNKVPVAYSLDNVRDQVTQTYEADVAGVIPHSDTLMALASRGIFALQYPDHPVAAVYSEIAGYLL